MEYYKLPNTITRYLSDKLYDRRKLGATEIRQIVEKFVFQKEQQKIKDIIVFVEKEFIYSSSINSRKGGLLAIAAITLGLGTEIPTFLSLLLPPVLRTVQDKDPKIRFYSCESLYNIIKASKGHILLYFNETFDRLCQLVADPDKAVRDATELLDRLMKEIVCANDLDFEKFIPLLSYAVNALTVANCRRFVISWIRVFDSVPSIDILKALPCFLDGLFKMLADPNDDIRQSVDTCLTSFLDDICEIYKNTPEEMHRMVSARNIEILGKRKKLSPAKTKQSLMLSESPTDDLIRLKDEISTLGDNVDATGGNGDNNSAYARASASGNMNDENWTTATTESSTTIDAADQSLHLPGEDGLTLVATSPLEAPRPSKDETKLEAEASEPTMTTTTTIGVMRDKDQLGNPQKTRSQFLRFGGIIKILIPHCKSKDEFTLLTAVHWLNEFILFGKEKTLPYVANILGVVLLQVSHKYPQISSTAERASNNLAKIVKNTQQQFVVKEVMTVLVRLLKNTWVPTRLRAVSWLNILQCRPQCSVELTNQSEVLLPQLLQMLQDPSEEIVHVVLLVLSRFALANDEYFEKLIASLIDLLVVEARLMEFRTRLIVSHLALYIPPQKVLQAFSAHLVAKDVGPVFTSAMIQILNDLLLTSIEMASVRDCLKSLSPESHELFCTLYHTWCYHEAAVFGLCLLAQKYEYASRLVVEFSKYSMSVNIFLELDRLVQLIETPVFIYLRLQLLDPDKYPFLFKCLFGLLMVLPQTEGFTDLKNRLHAITSLGTMALIRSTNSNSVVCDPSRIFVASLLSDDQMLEEFKCAQKKHDSHTKQIEAKKRDAFQQQH